MTTASHSRTFRFGIVGCGVIAPTHAQALAEIEGAQLVAATDLDVTKTRAFAERFGVDAEADLDSLLGRDDIDAVSVCVPSGLHAEVGALTARAGKHLVVEKPIDITVEAADRLIGAARQAGVVMTVISQHRFDPGVRRMRELIDSGRLGRLVLGQAIVKWYRSQSYYDSGDWRGTWRLDGGGALMNQGVHYVDLLRWMMGPVEEVTALTATEDHSIEVEDLALALLRFESGALGTIEASTVVYPGLPERLEVSGTAGTVIVEAGTLRLEELADERGEVGAYGASHKHRPQPASTGAADPAAISGSAHKLQLEDFLAALRDHREPSMTGEAARDAVAVICAVYESARAAKAVRPAASGAV